jgi:hypothetical protein
VPEIVIGTLEIPMPEGVEIFPEILDVVDVGDAVVLLLNTGGITGAELLLAAAVELPPPPPHPTISIETKATNDKQIFAFMTYLPFCFWLKISLG